MNAVNSAILDPTTGWFILALFSALWVALGWYWGRHAQRLDEYVLAGRRVGVALGTATAMATWVTSNTTMAAPQLAFQMGIWGMIGYSLGSVGLMLFAPLSFLMVILSMAPSIIRHELHSFAITCRA